MTKRKILLLTDTIAPYRIPVFNLVAENETLDFTVLSLTKNMVGREWQLDEGSIRFKYRTLNSMQFHISLSDRPPLVVSTGLKTALEDINPELIIITGYYQPAFLRALLYSKKKNIKIICWVESNLKSLRINSFFSYHYKKWFINMCDGFIVPGMRSMEFLLSLNVDENSIYIAPNAVDNNFFMERSKDIRKKKEEIKRKKRYPAKIILYVGRIIRKKGVYELLDAYKSVITKDIGLIFVGSGRDEDLLKKRVVKEAISNVFFEGFKQIDDLPFYYGIADLFVLPSHNEEWGLVVNEACASGLPVISSFSTGAAAELVSEQNGALYEKGDIEGLIDSIRRILADGSIREAMGQRSRELVSGYSPEICASRIIEAARKILSL